jgi:hypothetical protein
MGIEVLRMRRVLCAAVVCAAVAIGAGGYGTASASTAGDPLSGLSADQIASKAVANLKTASTVRLTGNVSSSGQTYDLNLALVSAKGCTGTIAQVGTGTFKYVVIGNEIWIQPDRQFLDKTAGIDAAALKVLSGKYLNVKATSQFGGLRALCSPSQLAASFDNGAADLEKGKTVTISGQPALQINQKGTPASIFVSETTQPELLRISGGSNGTLDFSDYNGSVTLTAPPASETLSGAKYGF